MLLCAALFPDAKLTAGKIAVTSLALAVGEVFPEAFAGFVTDEGVLQGTLAVTVPLVAAGPAFETEIK